MRSTLGRERRALGGHGEALAAQFLSEKGYTILKRNYTCRLGEVDTVAYDRKREQLVFVEVKTRRGIPQGTPEEAAHPRKMQKVHRAAMWLLARNPKFGENYRFDMVAIVMHHAATSKKPHEIRHYEHIPFQD